MEYFLFPTNWKLPRKLEDELYQGMVNTTLICASLHSTEIETTKVHFLSEKGGAGHLSRVRRCLDCHSHVQHCGQFELQNEKQTLLSYHIPRSSFT